MGFIKALLKSLNTERRFQEAYESLEERGFKLFLANMSISGETDDVFRRKARSYSKAVNNIDKLYSKWKS